MYGVYIMYSVEKLRKALSSFITHVSRVKKAKVSERSKPKAFVDNVFLVTFGCLRHVHHVRKKF